MHAGGDFAWPVLLGLVGALDNPQNGARVFALLVSLRSAGA